MDFWQELSAQFIRQFGPAVVAWCGFTAAELAFPRSRVSWRSRASGLSFWLALFLVTSIAYAALGILWRALGIRPLLVIPLRLEWAGAMAGVVAPILSAVVYDFFFYWFHRAQHRWLWRFHAVHHSVEELSAVTSYHHITEPLFQWFGIIIPVSLIVSDSAVAAPMIAVLLHFHGFYIHSSVRLGLGPLRILVCDNHFHRIHHSVESRHFDRNFGAFTTLWDRLFGTAHFPEPGEWPATGIAGIAQPSGMRSWLTLPLIRQATDSVPVEAPPAAVANPA